MVTGPEPDELELELDELEELELLFDDELLEELLDELLEELLDDEPPVSLRPPHAVKPEKALSRLAITIKRAVQRTKLGRIGITLVNVSIDQTYCDGIQGSAQRTNAHPLSHSTGAHWPALLPTALFARRTKLPSGAPQPALRLRISQLTLVARAPYFSRPFGRGPTPPQHSAPVTPPI